MRYDGNQSPQFENMLDEGDFNASVQDAASLLYNYSITNTPYSGPVGYLSGYGFLANADYRAVYIPLVVTEDNNPNRVNEAKLREVLSNGNLATSLTSFMFQTSGVLQANELFYWDELSESFSKTSNIKTIKGFEAAQNMSQVSKSFSKVVSWVNVAFVAGQTAVDGLNINTGSDAVVCAIGFIPGVGWVIAGIYTVSNAIVTGVTEKTIPEHTRDWLYDKYCRAMHDLKNWMMCQFMAPLLWMR